MKKSTIVLIAVPAILLGITYSQYPKIEKMVAVSFGLNDSDILIKANLGDAASQYTIGTYYEFGGGVLFPIDKKKAAEYYQKAASQRHAASLYNLGRLYKIEPELALETSDQSPADISRDLIEKSAYLGDDHAQVDLGTMYENGEGVPQDLKKAADLYTKAADQNYGPALIKLADFYRLGIGVEKDPAKAVELLIKATQLGIPGHPAYPEAYSMLSMIFEMGDGVPVDMDKALDYRKNAEKFSVNNR